MVHIVLIEILFRNPALFADICNTNDGLVSTVLSRRVRRVGIFFCGYAVKSKKSIE